MRFVALCEKYQHSIKAILYGHVHEDSFQLLHTMGNNKTFFGYGHLVPSMGTFSNLNPAFQIFYFDKTTYELVEKDTYRVYINEANQNNKLEWKLSYRFSDYYNYTYPNLQSYIDLYYKIPTNKEIALKFAKMKFAEAGNWRNKVNEPTWMRSVLCKISTATMPEYEICDGPVNHTGAYEKFRNLVGELFTSLEWNYLKYD